MPDNVFGEKDTPMLCKAFRVEKGCFHSSVFLSIKACSSTTACLRPYVRHGIGCNDYITQPAYTHTITARFDIRVRAAGSMLGKKDGTALSIAYITDESYFHLSCPLYVKLTSPPLNALGVL
jgi:hypothetical protein